MKQRITGFGAAGLNTDVAPSLLPPAAVTAAYNVIVEDESVRSAYGETKLFGLSVDVNPDGTTASWATISGWTKHYWRSAEIITSATGAPARKNGDPAEVGDVVYTDGVSWINIGPDNMLYIEPVYHAVYINSTSTAAPVDKQWIIISNGNDVVAFAMDGAHQILTPSDTGVAGTATVYYPLGGGVVSFANLNGVLVVNSETGGPHYWPGPGASAALANNLLQLPGPGDRVRGWLSGSGAPAGGTGAVGDYYWRTDTSAWYVKTGASTWQLCSAVAGTVEFGWDWQQDWRCKWMGAYRYNLVALGMREGAISGGLDTWYVHKVRWSTAAPEGDLPVDWAPLDANSAGDDLIGDTQGAIVAGAPIRDHYYIVKEDAIFQMRWIGGQYIMELSRLQDTIGTNIPRGICSMGGHIVVLTATDLLLFDGTTQRSISDGRVRRGIFSELSEDFWFRSQVYYHEPTTSLYVSAVEAGHKHLSAAAVFSLASGAWGHKRLHYGYGFDTGFVSLADGMPTFDDMAPPPTDYPPPQISTGYPFDYYYDVTFSKGVYQPSVPDVLLYESNGLDPGDPQAEYWLSVMAQSNTDYSKAPKTCEVMRMGIPITGAHDIVQVNNVWVETSGDAPVVINVGGQEAMGSSVEWSHNKDGGIDYVLEPLTTTPIDVMVPGRFIAWRLRSQSAGQWSLHGITIDYEDAGE